MSCEKNLPLEPLRLLIPVPYPSANPMSTGYIVNVFDSETRVSMVGNSDVHANEGSKVVFTCRIFGTLRTPDFVFWYHNSDRIMPDYSKDVTSTFR